MQSVLEAVQKKRLKRREPAKHEELKEWLWHFTMHIAHGLAKVCSRSVIAIPQTCRLHDVMSKAQHVCTGVAAQKVMLYDVTVVTLTCLAASLTGMSLRVRAISTAAC